MSISLKQMSGRAVMDYDEDTLIVDVEDGARTRSYNVRREEIVAPGTAVEEEETPAVDGNAVQEDDVQTDTGNLLTCRLHGSSRWTWHNAMWTIGKG